MIHVYTYTPLKISKNFFFELPFRISFDRASARIHNLMLSKASFFPPPPPPPGYTLLAQVAQQPQY